MNVFKYGVPPPTWPTRQEVSAEQLERLRKLMQDAAGRPQDPLIAWAKAAPPTRAEFEGLNAQLKRFDDRITALEQAQRIAKRKRKAKR